MATQIEEDIPELPIPPYKNVDSGATFVTKAEAFRQALKDVFQPAMNYVINKINIISNEVSANTIIAENSAIIASGLANFKGVWSNIVSYSKGQSVESIIGSKIYYTSKVDNNINHAVTDLDFWLPNPINEKLNVSAYTANDVLTKIKSVDGTGSGLDADLLDGKQATDFMQLGSSTQDLNNMKTAGTYRVESGHLNMPSGVDYGNILVLRTPGANTYSQIIMDWNSTNIYWRSGSDAVGWQPWRRILSDGNALTTTPLGYVSALGVGGVVVQSSLKTDTVTLNKLSGRITMSPIALAGQTSVNFALLNTYIGNNDIVIPIADWILNPNNYRIECSALSAGACNFRITNISNAPLSEAISFKFLVFKGAIS